MTFLVVGAGISGLACARALADVDAPVRVLDRGRRPGGRMGGRTLHGRAVDLGASYFTVSDGSPFAGVVDGWVERGLARPWTDRFAVAGPDGVRDVAVGPLRYGATSGLRSLVEDLAVGLDVTGEREVGSVGWSAAGETVVDGEVVPGAVLAMPDPQARRLLEPSSAAWAAADAEYEPALAVALGFARREWPADLHGAFVNDSEVISWIADDGDRRGDGAPVLVAHTTAGFARTRLDDVEAAVPDVVAAVTAALGLAGEPEWTHAHRWTFAKPSAPREEPFFLDGGLGLCGDSWHAPSKVESAWLSGAMLGTALGLPD